MKDVDAFLRVIGGFEFCENAADERGSRRISASRSGRMSVAGGGGVSGTIGFMGVILK
ncbi:MAG: hypothetical protein ACLUNN_06700 [Alistipes finegoldii]